METNKDIAVLYHANCLDGFSGAWVAWRKFGERADYLPVVHQLPPPVVKNKTVYFIDFLYPPEITQKFIEENREVVGIDHHITSKISADLLEKRNFALDRSGSVLAWEYFFPAEKLPKLLTYVQAIDFYQFTLPQAKEVQTFLDIQPIDDFRRWDKLVKDFEDSQKFEKIATEGSYYLKYKQSIIKEIVNKSFVAEFEGYKILVANSSVFASDVGHELYTKRPPISVTWYHLGNKINVSLRSAGLVDVGEIAKKYGGGGHKNSAGFKLDADKPLPWKITSQNDYS